MLTLAIAPARSRAAAYLPPAGKLYAGITAGDPATYEQQTRAHAAIFQEFITWGATSNWALAHRLLLGMAELGRTRPILR